MNSREIAWNHNDYVDAIFGATQRVPKYSANVPGLGLGLGGGSEENKGNRSYRCSSWPKLKG